MSRTRRVLTALTAVLLGAGLLAGCGDDGPDPEQAVLDVGGVATVTRADGTELTVTADDVTLELGDRARIDAGTGTLTLFGGTVAELRVTDGTGSEVVLAAVPELAAGELLVVEGDPAQVRVGGAQVSIDGVARLAAGGGVAVYRGAATVRGLGEELWVPALRESPLTVAGTTTPLDYDAADDWDRRFLAEAIMFGERLETLARGFTAELRPGADAGASFYEAVLPALAAEREFGDDLLDPARDPGETLVGAAIAVQGTDGPFRERWLEVFAFRDQGAAWGLVALDQRVSTAPLLDTIELAVGEAPLSDDPAPTTTTTAPRPGRPTTTEPPSSPTTTTAPPRPDPEDPPDDPGDPDEPGTLDPLLDPLDDTLDELLDTLGLGPSAGDGSVIDDATDTVGGLLGP